MTPAAAAAVSPEARFRPRELTQLELWSGLVPGREPGAPRLARRTTGDTITALESAIMPALLRAPCTVSFSGGRDSSLVLAAAMRIARREGLPEPVPVTVRFPGDGASEESAWQEVVIRHLRVGSWERLVFTDEMDVLGPFATQVLRRHGVLWPFNTYFHLPILELSRGGAMLTGVGGDEVFEVSGWREAWDAARVRRDPVRRVRGLAADLAPRPLRRMHHRRRTDVPGAWLTAAARQALREAWARRAADEPLGWGAGLRYWSGLRYPWLARTSLDTVAVHEDVRVVHPFMYGGFVEAVASAGGFAGPASRADAMRRFAPRLLPDVAMERRSKAKFNDVFFTRHSRRFVSDWGGEGVDRELIDAAELASEWRRPEPHPQSYLALQATWLATSR